MTAADLLTVLEAGGVRLEAEGDRLRYSPRSLVTPDLVDELEAHKGEILAMLTGPDNSDETDDPWGDSWADAFDPVPCSNCGGLVIWWNVLGVARCMDCDPPTDRAMRFLESAERIRRKHGLEAPGSTLMSGDGTRRPRIR